MRLAAYAGASTALAAGVVVYAFNQRANFYSACVYLAQSNLCLMILTNLILFIIASSMFGLQRIFYGPLRPIEIEQLYEKAWFAVTETCLAMTIFREEVGAWFLVMFVGLLAGKVWGWIGEGRVEILEQQPPANPRLFHLRLSFSLFLSVAYDVWIMAYTIRTVIQLARPNMMVMFLFEFAILTTSSFSTALRYAISLIETSIIKSQTQELLQARKRQIREQREDILRRREAAAAESSTSEAAEAHEALPSEDDVEEIDIEAPGWEAKGQWVLTLDLATDFVKLGIYSAFFFILLTFYGLPIHIMRDLFLTARSFVKRLTAFIKYRNATRDMMRYPDATAEEIQREDTCIICREEMRPWAATNPPQQNGGQPPANGRVTTMPLVNERSRPKKLPCGHVLHLGCLKSWLERQQVCPTCRRPVVDNDRAGPGQAQRIGQGGPAQLPGQVPLPGLGGAAVGAGGQDQVQRPPQPNNGAVGGMINIGPLRLNFGRGPMPNLAQGFGGAQPGQQNVLPANARVYGLEFGFPRFQPQMQGQAPPAGGGVGTTIQAQLQQIEQQIMQDLQSLSLNQAQLQIVQNLQAELNRLRQLQNNPNTQQQTNPTPILQPQPLPMHVAPAAVQRLGPTSGTSAISSGSSDLPPGVTIPEGWTLLPLQNLDSLGIHQASSVQPAPLTNDTIPSAHSGPSRLTPSPTSSTNPGGAGSVRATDQPPAANSLSAPPPSRHSTADRSFSSGVDGQSTSLYQSSQPNGELPNWGSSQLFRTPRRSDVGDMGTGTGTVNGNTPDSYKPKSPAALGDGSQPTTSVQMETTAADMKQEKGKGKAVTVEEDPDDDL